MRRLALTVLLAACLPQVGPPLDDSGQSGGGSAGGGGGTNGTGGGAAGGDPGCVGFAGCLVFADHTAATDARQIAFPNGNDTYSPRCMRVQAGQTVTFTGSFSSHPLEGACGPGAARVPTTTSGSSAQVTLTAAGVYGYYCGQHGSASGSGMAGAIEVVR